MSVATDRIKKKTTIFPDLHNSAGPRNGTFVGKNASSGLPLIQKEKKRSMSASNSQTGYAIFISFGFTMIITETGFTKEISVQ